MGCGVGWSYKLCHSVCAFECVLVPSFSSDSPTHSLTSHCSALLKFRDSNKFNPQSHKLRILSLGIVFFYLLYGLCSFCYLLVILNHCMRFCTHAHKLVTINHMQAGSRATCSIILSAQCARQASFEAEENIMSQCKYNKMLPDLWRASQFPSLHNTFPAYTNAKRERSYRSTYPIPKTIRLVLIKFGGFAH